MRAVPAIALLLAPALAGADPSDHRPPVATVPTVTKVVGGTSAPAGKWPDVAAMMFDGQQSCTGTLIAPTVVLTAGHCNDTALTTVLIGTNSLNRAADGETLTVASRHELTQNDITVVVLAAPSRFAPRAIASGWASFDIANAATVQLVGYGATDTAGNVYPTDLKEAPSTITDFNCSMQSGCSQFELGAGGMGIDTCFGDSGGPLYLTTPYGDFLAGVTSRGYDNSTTACGGGGIYGRPDQVIAAIEAAAGVPVTHGPEPTATEPLIALRGGAGETTIDANDPKSESHTFTISTQPTMGIAKVREDGTVRVCMNADATPGDADSVGVTVTDTTNATRTLAVKLKISTAVNSADGTCDVTAFESGDGGGCCDSGGRAGGAIPLAFGVGIVLRRRRRRR